MDRFDGGFAVEDYPLGFMELVEVHNVEQMCDENNKGRGSECSNLLESCTDFLAEDDFEGEFLHTDDVDGFEFTFGDGDDEFHADERTADDDEVLAFLDR